MSITIMMKPQVVNSNNGKKLFKDLNHLMMKNKKILIIQCLVLLGALLPLCQTARAQAPNISWDKTYGGSSLENIQALTKGPSGRILVVGGSYSGIGFDKSEDSRESEDYWVILIDKEGNKIWDKTFGGADRDRLTCAISVADGFILGGDSRSGISGEKSQVNLGSDDYWIVKIRFSGQQNLG